MKLKQQRHTGKISTPNIFMTAVKPQNLCEKLCNEIILINNITDYGMNLCCFTCVDNVGVEPNDDTSQVCDPKCRLGQCCVDGKCLCIDPATLRADDCECMYVG